MSHKDELEYSASLLKELVQMAQARRDKVRTYFLEMAYAETCDRLREIHGSAIDEAGQELKAIGKAA